MDGKQVKKFVTHNSQKNSDKEDKQRQGKYLQTCSEFKSLEKRYNAKNHSLINLENKSSKQKRGLN